MIELSLSIAIFTLGVHYLLLYLFGENRYYNVYRQSFLAQPLYACHLCMTSVWGSIGYLFSQRFFQFGIEYDLWQFNAEHFALIVGMSALFNMLIYNTIERIQR